ncbi:neural Wiskott-Aldrich syndrome protein-like [Thalassophryne amazonica]|uniref:neural Wiskott-Aldrich syndrome protein-like n=1 Tax=Thalassophryne amazonica TaxID=390379 RepID=UPI0014715646|nr:neural Wiskott-Aldrich syndrome protein-like [Thalassophryne amazonica]
MWLGLSISNQRRNKNHPSLRRLGFVKHLLILRWAERMDSLLVTLKNIHLFRFMARKWQRSLSKKILTKTDIGSPYNFRHLIHVEEPEIKIDLNKLDPKLEKVFNMFGLSEATLKDKEARRIIYDFCYLGLYETVRSELNRGSNCRRSESSSALEPRDRCRPPPPPAGSSVPPCVMRAPSLSPPCLLFPPLAPPPILLAPYIPPLRCMPQRFLPSTILGSFRALDLPPFRPLCPPPLPPPPQDVLPPETSSLPTPAPPKSILRSLLEKMQQKYKDTEEYRDKFKWNIFAYMGRFLVNFIDSFIT